MYPSQQNQQNQQSQPNQQQDSYSSTPGRQPLQPHLNPTSHTAAQPYYQSYQGNPYYTTLQQQTSTYPSRTDPTTNLHGSQAQGNSSLTHSTFSSSTNNNTSTSSDIKSVTTSSNTTSKPPTTSPTANRLQTTYALPPLYGLQQQQQQSVPRLPQTGELQSYQAIPGSTIGSTQVQIPTQAYQFSNKEILIQNEGISELAYKLSQATPIPPFANITPTKKSMKAQHPRRSRRKSKFSKEQDDIIINMKKAGKSWVEIAEVAGVGTYLAARNRYQVLIGQQGGGNSECGPEDVLDLRGVVDDGELEKMKYLAKEFEKSTGRSYDYKQIRELLRYLFWKDPSNFDVDETYFNEMIKLQEEERRSNSSSRGEGSSSSSVLGGSTSSNHPITGSSNQMLLQQQSTATTATTTSSHSPYPQQQYLQPSLQRPGSATLPYQQQSSTSTSASASQQQHGGRPVPPK